MKEAAPEAPAIWARVLSLATVDTRPLRRHRDFRLLWIGQAIAFMGSMVTAVAVPFQVYQLTHSTLAVGALELVAFLPLVSLGLIGGAYADAHDRRRLVLLCGAGMMLTAALLAGNSVLRHPLLGLIFVVELLRNAVYAMQRPALDALLPRLVEKHELAAASALNSLRGTAGMILGPALGGLMIAGLGLPITYAVEIAAFGVSLLTLWLMRAVPPPTGAEPPSSRRIAEGLRYARSRQELIGTYAVDMVAMFFGMPAALFPAIADHLGGARILGLLFAAPAVGSLIATATSGWTNRVHRHGLAVTLAATAWGVAVIGFGLAQSLWPALLCLAAAGAADMVSGIFRTVIWNQTIPDHLRGRLAGIELISYTSGPTLGNFEAGAVAAAFGVTASILSGGVLCVVGAAACALLLPRFRRYDASR
ncbi:MAG TPA: MFS transporter [Candidatus Dormibacteraeota bacterium]